MFQLVERDWKVLWSQNEHHIIQAFMWMTIQVRCGREYKIIIHDVQ